MKKLFTNIFLFSALITLHVSCQKDTVNPSPILPAEKIVEFRNDDEFIRFSYSANGSVDKATVKTMLNTGNTVTDYKVAYTGNKIASLTTSSGDSIVPVYTNSILSRADYFEHDERTGYTTYNYVNGRLMRATVYSADEDDYFPELEFGFTYNEAGNINQTVFLISSGIPNNLVRGGHIDYEYDDKVNPLHAHNDLLALFWQVTSKNNITLENHFDDQLAPEDRYQYTYTYKSNGLPSKAVVKKGLPNQPSTTTNVEYTY